VWADGPIRHTRRVEKSKSLGLRWNPTFRNERERWATQGLWWRKGGPPARVIKGGGQECPPHIRAPQGLKPGSFLTILFGTTGRGCGKTHFVAGQTPSAAKAALILWNLTARVEAAPFQRDCPPRLFPQPLVVVPFPVLLDHRVQPSPRFLRPSRSLGGRNDNGLG